MDKNEIATELAELGQEEARLMRKLAKVQAKRCKLLCDHGEGIGVSPETMETARARKDDGG